MAACLHYLKSLPVLFFFFHVICAQVPYHDCLTTALNYTSNSTYENNLNRLLASLRENASFTGFYNTSVGKGADQVHGLVQCYKDISAGDCSTCADSAASQILELCPNSKAAVIWFDNCLLRYTSFNFFGIIDESKNSYVDGDSIPNPVQFKQLLRSFFNNLSMSATTKNSTLMYATGYVWYTDNITLYGLVECTGDLSLKSCDSCLKTSITTIWQCCSDRESARILSPSCVIRYEIYPFYGSLTPAPARPASSPPPPPANQSTTPSTPDNFPVSGGDSSKTAVILGTSVSVFLLLLLCIFLVCFFKRRKSRRQGTPDTSGMEGIRSMIYDLNSIKVATNNFTGANKLGEGGYGPVYKGELPDGQIIAVKKLSMNSTHGVTEFKNEVALVAKLQHRNLVRLLGCCCEQDEKILVYEYVPNKSLDNFLFGRASKRDLLDWATRFKIIAGIARGILYLHEDSRLRVIHRDLKASNILLDEDMNAKISDFGLARLLGMEQTHGNTSKIVGTYGYMSPEYAMKGQFSTKSDIFSFGVLLLEIVTGERNAAFYRADYSGDIVGYVWRLWRENRALELVDQRMPEPLQKNEILRCIHVGLLCVQENATERPTMSRVVLMLSNTSMTLAAPSSVGSLGGRSKMSKPILRMHDSKQGMSGPLFASSVACEDKRTFFIIHKRRPGFPFLKSKEIETSPCVGSSVSPQALRRRCEMEFKLRFAIFLLLLIHAFSSNDFIGNSCPIGLNYTTNSTFERNLRSLFLSLSGNASIATFYNMSFGRTPDQVYGMVLCRNDVSADNCRTCTTNSTMEMVRLCPNAKQGVIWYENCELRYSNENFFGVVDYEDEAYWCWIDRKINDEVLFYKGLTALMNNLIEMTTTDPSMLMFAAGEIELSVSQKIYGLVQCTRDVSMSDCRFCLEKAVSLIPVYCSGKMGGQVLKGSCNARFDTNIPFFYSKSIVISPENPDNSSAKGSERGNKGTVVVTVITVSGVLLLLNLLTCAVCWWLKRGSCTKKSRVEEGALEGKDRERERPRAIMFDFGTIRAATRDFSLANKLGEGGFGPVYKGTLINGQEIAVKRLSKSSRQGAREFNNEVELVAKLQHNNLVPLLGGCMEGDERLLVYDYHPNGSLNNFIFGNPTKRALLGWPARMDIIMGVARGLLYLHEDSRLKVIHRDLKASNILLDEQMKPKISDFGMATLFANDQTHAITTRVAGTFGYMAPEYIMKGQISVKADVFSFGVLLLEIISGRRNASAEESDGDRDLPNYAWRLWNEERASELMDRHVMVDQSNNSNRIEVLRYIQVGLLCVQEQAASRPKMSKVVHMLDSPFMQLPSPSPPAFSTARNTGGAPKGSDVDEIVGSCVASDPANARSDLPSSDTITLLEAR
ncbi:uncharacterized protein LOC116246309 [Nymphaea colorata]|nr:uncharacterized protein LOC116246309 [Nymphaea colorata]